MSGGAGWSPESDYRAFADFQITTEHDDFAGARSAPYSVKQWLAENELEGAEVQRLVRDLQSSRARHHVRSARVTLHRYKPAENRRMPKRKKKLSADPTTSEVLAAAGWRHRAAPGTGSRRDVWDETGKYLGRLPVADVNRLLRKRGLWPGKGGAMPKKKSAKKSAKKTTKRKAAKKTTKRKKSAAKRPAAAHRSSSPRLSAEELEQRAAGVWKGGKRKSAKTKRSSSRRATSTTRKKKSVEGKLVTAIAGHHLSRAGAQKLVKRAEQELAHLQKRQRDVRGFLNGMGHKPKKGRAKKASSHAARVLRKYGGKR